MEILDRLAVLSVPDIAAVVYAGFSTARGCMRGFADELARLLGLAAALAVALYTFRPAAAWAEEYTRLQGRAAAAAAFTGVLAGVLLALWLVRLLVRAVRPAGPPPTPGRVGGCAVGFLRAWMVVVIVFAVVNVWPHEYLNRTFGRDSVIGGVLLRALPSLRAGDVPDDLLQR